MIIPAHLVVDTVIGILTAQLPTFNTIIDRFYTGRRLNILKGMRPAVPSSSLPTLEVDYEGEELGWFAPRVQEEGTALKIEIAVDHGNPVVDVDLLSLLVSVTGNILAAPPNLRPPIADTGHYLYDSLPGQVSYREQDGRMRVASIAWKGKALVYLANSLFDPAMQWPRPVNFPIN